MELIRGIKFPVKLVKMELLGKASADARARAETIAKNAGNSLGELKKATMGIFRSHGKKQQ